ncbi:MAG: hypothetical protein IIB65_11110 [Proteobacteria bacterium]|nr:hypothetical protein [Pseudomonadota bacterium]
MHRTAENTGDDDAGLVAVTAGVIVVPAAGAMTGVILMIVALIGVAVLLVTRVPLIRTLTRVLIAR